MIDPEENGSAAILDRLVESVDLAEADEALRSSRERVDRHLVEGLRRRVGHLIRSDLHRAGSVAAIARLAAGMLDDRVAAAASHYASAMVAHRAGRFEEALKLYDTAEQLYLTESLELEAARLARPKIDVLMYLGRYQAALDLAACARLVFERHHERLPLAQLDMNVGNVFHRQDRYQQALEHYDRAREVFADLDDQLDLALVDLNRANIYVSLNDFDRSLALYHAAREKYEKLNMDLMVAQVNYSVAWLHFLRGRYDEAMSGFAEVKRHSLVLGDEAQGALCDLDSAEIYLQLNGYEDALESARTACEEFGRLKMNYEYAKGRMYAGIAHYQLGELEPAEDSLLEARDLFEAEENQIYVALVNLYLSDLYLSRREYDQAKQLARKAEAIFSDVRLQARAAYALLQQAKLELACGDLERARALSRQALAKAKGTEDRWLKYQAMHLQAKVQVLSGRDSSALRSLVQAVQVIEGMRSNIRVDEFKTTFLKDKLQVYEDLIELCLRDPQPQKVKDAFSYVEAAKSRTLVDLLSRSVRAKRIPSSTGNPRVYQEWRALCERLDWLYNRLNQNENSPGQRPMQITASLRAGIRSHEQKLSRLLRQLQVEDSEYSSLQAAPRIQVDQLASCLSPDEMIVEYFTTGQHLHAFLIDRKGFQLFPRLAERTGTLDLLRRLRYQLDKFVFNGQYVQDHASSMRVCIDEYLGRLYRDLVEPFEHRLDGSKLIFIPHDFLHYLPLHALRAGSDYLIDLREISYAPSANVFKLCSEKSGQESEHREWQALVLGVPDQAAPHIAAEVEAVRRWMPRAQTLLGEDATIEQFQAKAAEATYIHLASHALFRQDNPMFSALRLGNGWLNFYHLFNLDLRAELVTLSACQTGVNRVLAGDELVGLMRGFLYAGAPSLVLSLWSVNDRSTAEFMEILYSELGRAASKRAALRSAQLQIKERYPNPYYWAPFILTGRP